MKKIDNLVFDLYGFSEEERNSVLCKYLKDYLDSFMKKGGKSIWMYLKNKFEISKASFVFVLLIIFIIELSLFLLKDVEIHSKLTWVISGILLTIVLLFSVRKKIISLIYQRHRRPLLIWSFVYVIWYSLVVPHLCTIFPSFCFCSNIEPSLERFLVIIKLVFPILGIVLFTILFLLPTPLKKKKRKVEDKVEDKEIGILLPDEAINSAVKDIFGYEELAMNFVEIINNNGGKKNFIFGIESGRGQGKSSFLNLIKEKLPEEVTLFEFNPRHFSNEKELLRCFLDEFSSQLSQKYYLPNLNKDLQNYIKILTSGVTQKVLGIDIDLGVDKSLEDAKDNINKSLQTIDTKIIIVVDDVDRLSSNKAKTLFKVLDLCRKFYNTNYVLCYDNTNFNAIEDTLKVSKSKGKIISEEQIDNTNIRHYLEKIINVKYFLIPDIHKVKEYFYKVFTESCNHVFSEDSKVRIKSEIVIFSEASKVGIKSGIENLFKHYSIYKEYIYNPRAIKRLFNFFLVRYYGDIHKVRNLFDLDNGGLKFDDFIKLSILNLYYDHIYIDILIDIKLEDKEATPFFSGRGISKFKLIYDYDKNQSKYKINTGLDNYIEGLKEDEKQIIEDLFHPKVPKENGLFHANRIDDKAIYVGKTLNRYMELLETIPTVDFNTYISAQIDEFTDGKKTFEKIFTEVLSSVHGKVGAVKLLNTIESIVGEDKYQKISVFEKVIEYILENFHQYSVNSIGSCSDNVVKILNNSVGRENNFANCKYIGDYIFGRNRYSNRGIIDRRISEKWAIKGLYNAIHLIHYAERGTSFWNFQRGLVDEDVSNVPSAFYMKDICRHIYRRFKKEYIDKEKNVFEEVYNLNDSDLIQEEGVSGSLNGFIDSKKSILAYMLYRLTSSRSGTGYFDVNKKTREDQKHGIKKQLNKYYFDFCFLGSKGIEYFVNYIFGFISIRDHFKKEKELNQNLYIRINATDDGDGILDIFYEEKLLKFLDDRASEIQTYILDKKNTVFASYGGISFSYGFGRDLFQEAIKSKLTNSN